MSLTGTIDFGLHGLSWPTGAVLLIGTDGQHYAVSGTSSGVTGFEFRVGCVETETIIKSYTEASFNTDLASFAIGTSGTYDPTCIVPVTGTSDFWISSARGSNPNMQWAAVKYRINSPSDVVPLNVLWLIGGENTTPRAECYGCGIVDGKLWGVFETGFGNPSNSLGAWLYELPLSGNLVNGTFGSADAYGTRLSVDGDSHSFSWYSFRGFNGERLDYRDKVSIIADGTEVGLLRYIGQGETTAVHYLTRSAAVIANTEPNDAAFSAALIASIQDLSASFGVPFADTLKDYAGNVSITEVDDYTSPSIGPNGEVTFERSFSDNPNWVRDRSFTMLGPGSIVSHGTTDYEHNDEVFTSNPNSVQSYRVDNERLVGLRDSFRLIFGYLVQPAPGEPEEDEDDEEALCLFDWDECVLVPSDITVEVVSPTVSPGRALSGREMVIQPDAGSWRITLHDVKVWSDAELFLWREYESLLNGRVNTCCVPLYEGKLSATPIVATLGADAAAGVVRLTITQTAGATIRIGMHFQAGERAYRLVSGSGSAWKVWPPLRNAITSGTSLNFNDPRLRCRLERDDGMDIMLEHLKFGKRTVVFIEDV